MKTIFTLIFLLFSIQFYSQQPLDWAFNIDNVGIGSHDLPDGKAIVTDNNNNIYTTGVFSGDTVDFDPSSGVYNLITNNNDVFVQKVSNNGDLVWAISTTGSTNSCTGSGLAIDFDPSGYIYIIGNSGCFGGDPVDFDPGLGTFNLTGGQFIWKIDTLGNLVWAKNLNAKPIDIAVDLMGDIYITGEFKDTADFDPGVGVFQMISKGDNDGFVQKLNSNGDFVWAYQLGSSAFNSTGTIRERCISLIIDKNNDIIITGEFSGLTDFDPGPGIVNLSAPSIGSVFLQKIDVNKNLIWAKGGDYSQPVGGYIASDNQNNIYSSYVFIGTIDIDPNAGVSNLTPPIGDTTNIFIQKLSPNGNFIWGKNFGSLSSGFWASEFEFTTSIDVNNNGDVILSGGFYGTGDFDPGPANHIMTSTGENDIFILSLNSSGLFNWAGSIGGSSFDVITFLTHDNNDNVILSGETGSGIIDFDPTSSVYNLTSGVQQYFLLKLGYPLSVEENINESVLIYPNPTNSNLTFEIEESIKEIEIIDVSGKILKSIIPSSNEINLDFLKDGIYFFKLIFEDKVITRKIIKN